MSMRFNEMKTAILPYSTTFFHIKNSIPHKYEKIQRVYCRKRASE